MSAEDFKYILYLNEDKSVLVNASLPESISLYLDSIEDDKMETIEDSLVLTN